MSSFTALVDAHVHLHACYRPDEFFDQAYENLTRFGSPAVGSVVERYLLMTECAPDDYFGALSAQAKGAAPGSLRLERWSIQATPEPQTLIAQDGARRLYVVAGRQVACREGLEVLILGTLQRFRDGRPIREVLTEAGQLGVLHVIPWGPGKWFFARGKLVSALMREFSKPSLFLGDEGGRPAFWPYPAHFREGAPLGVRDLPGTDPLPFAHDVTKVGRVGLTVGMDFDAARPAASLFAALVNPGASIKRFASLEPPLRFVRNQIAMQLRKRRAG